MPNSFSTMTAAACSPTKASPRFMDVNATEKLYGDFVLTATNPGGHSSLPRPENAILRISRSATKIAQYQFPFELNNITRA